MNCEFCNNSFSSKHILVKHQKNTKYCLKLQQKEYVSSHKCEGCQKTFTTIYDLNIHIKKCKASEYFYTLQKEIETLENTNKEIILKMSEQEKIILEHKNTIKDLQNTIEKLETHAISRPTISTTKNTRKLIRQKFLKMKETEDIKIKEAENIKKQIQNEINNQNNEIKLMRHEDIAQQRIMFYKKMKVNKLDMYIEYLFDMKN